MLHIVRCIASERWVCAAERKLESKFSSLSWMVKNIRAGKVSGGGEQHHRAVSVEYVAELFQGGMSPQQKARVADQKR